MAEADLASAMAEAPIPRRRALGRSKKGSSKRKRTTAVPDGAPKKVKIDRRMKKLIRKRAKAYHSDDEDGDGEEKREKGDEAPEGISLEEPEEVEVVAEEEANEGEFSGGDEDGDVQPGIPNFFNGVRGFRLAFKSVVKKAAHDDPLGPVMSAHKTLVAEKLAEEDATERKVKRESQKAKRLIAEKGHVLPETYLNLHEKFLIGVATKGVVKLFNAVNKAQHAQKGLNPSRSKDEKDIRRRRKQAFFSELKKTHSTMENSMAGQKSSSQAEDEGPAWAPLRDNYMLTDSKLKDWDKMPEHTITDDIGVVAGDSSSDDE